MQNIEEIIKKSLSDYFSGAAYTRSDDKRFVALQVVLRDLTAGIRSKKAGAYGLPVPDNAQIAQITNCSTCPGVASKTKQARTVCEGFARQWLNRASNETAKKAEELKKLPDDKNPKTTFHNFQAFK